MRRRRLYEDLEQARKLNVVSADAKQALAAEGRWRRSASRLPLSRIEQKVRSGVFRLLRRITPRILVEGDGCRYYVSTTDMVGRRIFLQGHFEENVIRQALDLIRELSGKDLEGKVIVDVGANTGTTTIPAVVRYGASLAIAIEPDPTNLKLLKQNLIENDIEWRVKVIGAALSDTNQEGTLELAESNWGDHRVRVKGPGSQGWFGEGSRRTISIRLLQFDDALAQAGIELADVGLVWMDVQGHEANVLAGAVSLLASDIPVVTEYWPYGLHRAGGLDRFHELVAENYGRIVDIRRSESEGTVHGVEPGDLGRLATLYADTYTDLVLLK